MARYNTKEEAQIIELIEQYAMIDGAHHKQWVIDQIMRLIKGDEYNKWVREFNRDEDCEEWGVGIAP